MNCVLEKNFTSYLTLDQNVEQFSTSVLASKLDESLMSKYCSICEQLRSVLPQNFQSKESLVTFYLTLSRLNILKQSCKLIEALDVMLFHSLFVYILPQNCTEDLKIPILRIVLTMSEVISCGLENDPYPSFFELPCVTEPVFNCINTYLLYHIIHDPPLLLKPLQSNILTQCVNNEFDVSFLQHLNQENYLINVLHAADYLMINSLHSLCCFYIAFQLRYSRQTLNFI